MMRNSNPREGRVWPGYILGGRLRTSTVALLIAFFAVWWLYDVYEPAPRPHQVPASEVVPPGFIPDPNYTWAPRTDVKRQTPTTTPTTTTSVSPTTTSDSPTTTSTSPTTSASPGATPAEPSTTPPAGPGTATEPTRTTETPGPSAPARPRPTTQTPAAEAVGPSSAVVSPPQ